MGEARGVEGERVKPSDRTRFLASGAYPGGKSGAGVYQQLINRMPPHDTYIETHLGGGAILRRKRPARLNIGLDLDPEVIAHWRAAAPLEFAAGAAFAASGR